MNKIKGLFSKIKKPSMIAFYIIGALLVDGYVKTLFPTFGIIFEPIWITNCMARGMNYFS